VEDLPPVEARHAERGERLFDAGALERGEIKGTGRHQWRIRGSGLVLRHPMSQYKT
jgi:hypothetical protein